MSSCPDLLDQLQREEHVVQLYGADDRLLTANVSRFLAEGLKRGDGLLVIATPEHRTTLARKLRQDQSFPRAVLEGRLVFLDAETTLSRFMLHGAPDQQLFLAVVGETIRSVTARSLSSGGVRAHGEMVGLLWKSGAREAAVRLEAFWNDLLRRSGVSLFCAYPIDVFGPDFQPGELDPLLCSHTQLVPNNPALEQALARAMEDVLGPRLPDVRDSMGSNPRPAWGKLPRVEALVLSLREKLPEVAEQILERARQYSRTLQNPT